MAEPQKDGLPPSWIEKQELHFSDLIAFVTFFIFIISLFVGTTIFLDRRVFHFTPHVPLRDQHSSTRYMILWFAIGIPLVFVGKYLWLLVMSRFLTRADVAPLISYGVPRRLSRLDQALLGRYYRR